MRYVLDCTVAVRWFVPQTHFERAAEVLVSFQRGDLSLVAPDVIAPEFGHVLRKLVIGKSLTADQAYLFHDRFLQLPIEMVASRTLAESALRLAIEHSGTFYDALYVSLAVQQDAKVLTADDRMEAAFSRLQRTTPLAGFR